MANMSYCRFENTIKDIKDCIESLEDGNWDLDEMMKEASSKQEAQAMRRFVMLCKTVADGFEDSDV